MNAEAPKAASSVVLGQIQGKMMDSVNSIVASFNEEHLMESIGFTWGTSNPQALSDPEVEVEDELAGTIGKFGVSVAKHREKRIAYRYGWPHRMIFTLGEK